MKRSLAAALFLLCLAGPAPAQVTRPGGGGGTIASNGTGAAGRCALFLGTTIIGADSGCTYAGTGATFSLSPSHIYAGDGGVNTTSFGFASEPSLGLFRFGTGQLGVSVAGTVGWFDTNGFLLFGKRLDAYTSGIGETPTDGVVLENVGTATAILQQWSPRLRFTGSTWSTDDTQAYTSDFTIDAEGQSSAGGFNQLTFSARTGNPGGGPAYTKIMSLDFEVASVPALTMGPNNIIQLSGTGYVLSPLFIGPVTALKSATTTVVVNGAAAPTAGQPLVASSGVAAAWGTLGVPGGGTGNVSTTAFALQAGGTTTTGAHQAIASVATGQILASAGIGALPGYTATPVLGVAASQPGTIGLAKGVGGGNIWTLASGATSAWTETSEATAPTQGALETWSNGTGQRANVADVAVGSILVSGGVNTVPAYSASTTCTSSSATTCTIASQRSGCLPICSMTTAVSTTFRASISATTITCTFGTSGTNTCNCICP